MNFYTDHYYSNIGVPQGDPISPILFNLFISDLPSALTHRGVYLHNLRVHYIQYADDLCVIGDSKEDLQNGLDDLQRYCEENYIDINVRKTKIQVFHRGRLPECEFFLYGELVQKVNEFCYLGFTFSVQLSFSQHGKNVNTKARSKIGLLFSSLPLQNLPLDTVLELFNIFILPTFTYGLPLYISNCSNSTLQSIDATYTKFLKRYLQIPTHSNNAIIYFLTSTIPLSDKLKQLAPHSINSLSFPEELHGYSLSFLSSPVFNENRESTPIVESIPTAFWMSRTLFAIPTQPKLRKQLCREVLDSEHFSLCKTSAFHPSSTISCICKNCNSHAHMYHARSCENLM